jgi:site-specific DNA-methyltransferase (adenine-specific)
MEYSGYDQKFESGGIRLYHADCMKMLPQIPDKYYSLCICDPPYGIGDVFIPISTGVKPCKIERTHKAMEWDNAKPTDEYFTELRRVSKKQIIWGANYFNCFHRGGALVWYKNNGAPSLSQCEIASLSFKKSVDYIFIQVLGGFVQNNKPIHPTQKPIRLYEWLLKNYAKPGDKILDTHLGSGSSAIAADIMGFDFTGYEIDKDYFEAAKKRLEIHQMQQKLF